MVRSFSTSLPTRSAWAAPASLLCTVALATACQLDVSATGTGDAGEPTTSDDPAPAIAADAALPPVVRDDAGESASTCNADGRYRVRVELDVSWVGTRFANVVPIVSPGRGQLAFILLIDLFDSTNEGGNARIHVCQAEVPEFVSTLPGEHYAVSFADALWDTAGMPTFDTPWSGCGDRKCPFTMPAIHALIGSALADPAGAWPESSESDAWVDSDGDGRPGVPASMLGPKPRTALKYPPLDIVGARRASDLDLGLRVVFGVEGERASCDAFSGSVREGAVDTRALGCTPTSEPKRCSAAELRFLNENLPVWTVNSGRVVGARVASDAPCADVRSAYD